MTDAIIIVVIFCVSCILGVYVNKINTIKRIVSDPDLTPPEKVSKIHRFLYT